MRSRARKKGRILKILFFLFVIINYMFLPNSTIITKAESGVCGENATWTLEEDGTLIITGSGEMYDFNFYSVWNAKGIKYCSSAPWSDLHVEKVLITEGITSIGENAFVGMSTIREVTMADTVEKLSTFSFSQCEGISDLVLPDSIIELQVDAIANCFGLESITLPKSLDYIEKSFLSNNRNLTHIYISNDSEKYCSIEGVLYNKSGDTLVFYPPGRNVVSLTDGVKIIGEEAFYDSCIEHYELPKGVETISSRAIEKEGASLFIPSSVSQIDDSAFVSVFRYIEVAEDSEFYCIENEILYNKDKTILLSAFNKDNRIAIPDTVTKICYGAFRYCTAQEIIIPDSVVEIGDCSFFGCENLTEISLPKSLQKLGRGAFMSCSSLQRVETDCDITDLPDHVFYGCNNLTFFEIPSSVERIGYSALHSKDIQKIIIPKSVIEVRPGIFNGMDSLTDIYYCGSEEEFQEIGVVDTENRHVFNDLHETIEETIDDYEKVTIHYYYRSFDDSFSIVQSGWSFANSSMSFAEEPASHADDYFIPRERYDALFGSSYVDSTEGLYTEKWKGNCAGMSATAILFFLDKLDWEGIDAKYSEDFLYPNSFYRTVNLHNRAQSYYPAIGNDNEVTRLIEAYQLYINAIDKSGVVEKLDNTYFEADATQKKTLFGSEYIVNHVADGTYITTMLAEFQEAYNENNPRLIVLQADGFGHGIVSRTDLKPEDMGDGWWRVYVYDPNKPYINESVSSVVNGVEVEPKYTFGCNDLIDSGGDIYLELNPSLNQWRYCTSVNSNSTDSYIGSSPSGELLWKSYYHDATPNNENDDEGKKNNAKIPEFFYTIDLTDLTLEDFLNPHFDSTSAWIPQNDLAVAVDSSTDCSIYASTGELVAIVEDGDAFVLSDVGTYDAYIGQSEHGGSLGGKIYLPNDVYTVYYTSGIVQFLGSDNALSFSCKGAAELTVDITLNSVQIIAQEKGIAAVKCANVTSTDECSYVGTEGALVAGETFTIAYSDENEVIAETNSKEGTFTLYQKESGQAEAIKTGTISANKYLWLWIIGGVGVCAIISASIAVVILVKRKK